MFLPSLGNAFPSLLAACRHFCCCCFIRRDFPFYTLVEAEEFYFLVGQWHSICGPIFKQHIVIMSACFRQRKRNRSLGAMVIFHVLSIFPHFILMGTSRSWFYYTSYFEATGHHNLNFKRVVSVCLINFSVFVSVYLSVYAQPLWSSRVLFTG